MSWQLTMCNKIGKNEQCNKKKLNTSSYGLGLLIIMLSKPPWGSDIVKTVLTDDSNVFHHRHMK